MPQIVTKSHFQKENALNIPLAIENPTATVSTATPNNSGALDNLCIEIEKTLLLNALGLTLYNELQTALADIDNVDNAKWKKLVNGEEYDGKMWSGLKQDLSFIAQHVYEVFITTRNESLSATGAVQTKPENGNLTTPAYKIANANQLFIKGYQGGFMQYPDVYFNRGIEVIDYYGVYEEVEVSFYRYLLDKQADFPTWKPEMFRTYCTDEVKNSFGL